MLAPGTDIQQSLSQADFLLIGEWFKASFAGVASNVSEKVPVHIHNDFHQSFLNNKFDLGFVMRPLAV